MSDTKISEAVAWFTEDHLTDKSATTYDPAIAERWRAKGWPVTALYTHPQPAELAFDVEAMLAACVPGGNIVDPQVVADNIRAWAAERKSAELAEQQGVALRYLTQRELDSIGSQAEGMDGEQWDRWVQAKFAEVNGLATVDSDGFIALAATGKQQVGEVQGDALVALADKWDRAKQVPRYEDEDGVHYCAEQLRAALATRQPGAQEPVSPMAKMAAALREKAAIEHTEYSQRVQSGEWGPMPEAGTQANFCRHCGGSGWDGESRESKCPACYGTGIAGPPAQQGIDLGQFRPAVELLVQKAKDGVTGCRMYWGPTNPDAAEKAAQKLAEANRLLALIDHRDAGHPSDREDAK